MVIVTDYDVCAGVTWVLLFTQTYSTGNESAVEIVLSEKGHLCLEKSGEEVVTLANGMSLLPLFWSLCRRLHC